jgi:hypothetical protein
MPHVARAAFVLPGRFSRRITLAGGRSAAVLGFLAVAGKTYTVQFRDRVTQGDWQRLADVLATGAHRMAGGMDPGAGACSQGGYRLARPPAP